MSPENSPGPGEGTHMGLFDDAEKLLGEGEQLAKDHPDQVNQAVTDAENWADQQTGGRFDSEVQGLGNRAETYLENQ